MKNWRIIKTEADYEHAMKRLLELTDTDLEENSDDFDEFEMLSLLIGHYDESHYLMDKPNPVEAIKFRMEQMDLSQADMRQYLGSSSKVSEVLSGKRKLSLSMIRRLHDGLGIPADILIQDTDNIEWSPVSFGVESLAIAFSDVCKAQTQTHGFLDKGSVGVEMILTTVQEIPNPTSDVHINTTHVAIPVHCY